MKNTIVERQYVEKVESITCDVCKANDTECQCVKKVDNNDR